MNFAQIQLICVILAKIIFIIVPFAVFRGEWRYTMSKTAGILMGYLFFVCPIGLDMLPAFPEPALAGDGVGLYHHDDQHIGL